MAKLEGDGWLIWTEMGHEGKGRRVATLVALPLAKAALWVRIRHLSKYKTGDISKEVANTL